MGASKMNAPPFLPRRHLEAIGNLATYWNWFEVVFDATIWALLGVRHKPGAAITAEVGILTKIDSLKILSYHHLARRPTRQAHLEVLIKRVNPLRVKRNMYVHHWWFYSRGAQKSKGWKITARGAHADLRLAESSVRAEDIERAAYEVWQLTLDWMCFLQATFPRYSFPWQRISRAEARRRNLESRNHGPGRLSTPHERPLTGEHLRRNCDLARWFARVSHEG
jgi:hypothetical protein